jgi:two-component system, LuxR family, response regulator FixJ
MLAQIPPNNGKHEHPSAGPKAEPVVYIVDDELPMRQSLQFLIETPGIAVETFATADRFLEAYDPARPGCLLLDMQLPGMSGRELLRVLPERGIRLPVIVLTAYGSVSTAVNTIHEGADDFLEKPCDGEMLIDKIRRALTRDIRQRAERADVIASQERLRRLTERESEVLQCVAREWLSSKEIAQRLQISRKTVEAHRAKIMEKTEAESVAELVWLVASTENFGDPRSPGPGGEPEQGE